MITGELWDNFEIEVRVNDCGEVAYVYREIRIQGIYFKRGRA